VSLLPISILYAILSHHHKEKIMRWTYCFFVLIPILNIGLNYFAHKSASKGSGYWSTVFSTSFAIAFVIGICSILSMLALYRNGTPLYRGILFMGALSIIVGSAWAAYSQKVVPDRIEFALIFCLVMLVGYRWFNSFIYAGS
jgi:undecaprenyl pyrophosphate phosphatase UppP